MKKFSITILIFVGYFVFAQNTYIDVTTTLALKLYSDNLENQQEKTIEQQTKLQQAQTWVATQMTVANDIQNKVLKGLNEVSGTLKNGVQVVTIYSELDRCLQYSSDILTLTSNKPQSPASACLFPFTSPLMTVTYASISRAETSVPSLN